jgi:beta-glucanase (GH16 family)
MLKKVIVLAFNLVLCFSIIGNSSCNDKSNPVKNQEEQIDVPQGWKLVWNDEFNDSAINQYKWEHEVNADGGGNNELQYYTARKENSFISNGNLVIRAIKEKYTSTDGARDYTSARLRTLNKGDWKYGRFDIRAKMPQGKGLWPAIWMLPTDWAYGGWASSGEIDIVELIGHEPNIIHGTIHFGGEWPKNQSAGKAYTLQLGNFSDNFHVFTVEWEAQEIRWYVDGILFYTETEWSSEKANYPAPFDQQFHLLLNVAVGGNWPGSPDASTTFPQEMQIDYVRVYEKL